MTDALVQFLHDRLDEDEQAAAAASAGPWTPWRRKALLRGLGQLEHAVTLPGEGVGSRASIVTASWLDAEHIARHDPARVLTEVDAKRAIVDWVEECRAFFWQTDSTLTPSAYRVLAPLAVVYADHPDYREEWRP
jgi:hypothetical protein